MDRAELERVHAPYPDALTSGEVAKVLRVHLRSIQRWAEQGRFASVPVGRGCRIMKADVIRLMLAASTPCARREASPARRENHSARSLDGDG